VNQVQKIVHTGICSVCNRMLQLWESAWNGASAIGSHRIASEQTQLSTCHPWTLYDRRPETVWNVDWHYAGLQNTVCLDSGGLKQQ
jgi:hypothetical protein